MRLRSEHGDDQSLMSACWKNMEMIWFSFMILWIEVLGFDPGKSQQMRYIPAVAIYVSQSISIYPNLSLSVGICQDLQREICQMWTCQDLPRFAEIWLSNFAKKVPSSAFKKIWRNSGTVMSNSPESSEIFKTQFLKMLKLLLGGPPR